MKPMLAADISDDLDKLRFPTYVCPKLDGVRALITRDGVLSRSLKQIPNKHVQRILHDSEIFGLDGELIVGSPTASDVYRVTNSATARIEGEPQFAFHVFDDFQLENSEYRSRLHELRSICNLTFLPVQVVEARYVTGMEELELVEAEFTGKGYEGVICRAPEGKYKHGRSTIKEQGMLKLKRFKDAEAVVLSIEEEMENRNEAKINALGHTERSSHKGNLVGKGTMGALNVRDTASGVEFKIGTGFTAADRKLDDWIGKTVKYRYFPVGVKDKPRHPSYLGRREDWDQ